jgi:hypothetical protein
VEISYLLHCFSTVVFLNQCCLLLPNIFGNRDHIIFQDGQPVEGHRFHIGPPTKQGFPQNSVGVTVQATGRAEVSGASLWVISTFDTV